MGHKEFGTIFGLHLMSSRNRCSFIATATVMDNPTQTALPPGERRLGYIYLYDNVEKRRDEVCLATVRFSTRSASYVPMA